MRTELPEKWCIIIQEHTRDILKDWFKENLCKNTTQSFTVGVYYWYELKNNYTINVDFNKPNDDFIITFEEFERLVLNKLTEPQYEVY